MKSRKILLKSIYILLFSKCLTSCIIETAKAPSKQSVKIYTDCLSSKEIIFFKKFQQIEHIKVKIIHLPTDTILKKLKKQGFNTTADVVILKSLFGISKANKLDLLQPWKSWKMNELILPHYRSKQNTWFGIGIDPYVFVAKNDSVSTINSMGDLLYTEVMDKWSSDLENSTDLVPLLAPILKKKTRLGAKDWYYEFKRNQHSQANELDQEGIPNMTTDVLLTYYSSYLKMSERNDSTDLQLQLLFSNQKQRGAYYNMHCIGIVKQARNFENAKLLVEYISSAQTNEKLNNFWKSFPISLHSRIHPFAYQNTFFKIATISHQRLMVNYPHLEKIILKNKNEKNKTE